MRYQVRALELAIQIAQLRFSPIQMAFIKEKALRLEDWSEQETDLADLAIEPLFGPDAYRPIFALKEMGNVLDDKKLKVVFGVIERRNEVLILAIYDSWRQASVVDESTAAVFEHYVLFGEPASRLL
jgi:hypothetical protein